MDTLRIISLDFAICFITFVLWTGAYSQTNDVSVEPGPVKVKLGSNVELWCKLKYDSEKIVPVNWQSPPNFKTRTSDCVAFITEKYQVSCLDKGDPYGYYNLTINGVTWADNGIYRCLWTRHKSLVDLQVLVPVQKVTLTHVSNSTAEPLFLSKGTDAVLTCQTDCASPAPTISWSENDLSLKDNGNPIVNNTECTGAEKGQKRTTSIITVKGRYTEKDSKNSKITCSARNVNGEQPISKSVAINYDGPPGDIVPKDRASTSKDAATGQNVQAGPLTQAEIIGIAAGAGVGLLLILLGVACFLKTRRSTRGEEEDPMNKKPPPPEHV